MKPNEDVTREARVESTVGLGSSRTGGAFRNRAGVTLVELLVVVIVIGILSAMILPNMVWSRDITKDNEVQTLLISAGQAQEQYATQHNHYWRSGHPQNLQAFDLTIPSDLVLSVPTANASTYCMQAHPSSDASAVFSLKAGEGVLGVPCSAR